MYSYIAFFKNKRADITADSLLEAKQKAVAQFKAPASKAHNVHVHLAEKNGEPVLQTADF